MPLHQALSDEQSQSCLGDRKLSFGEYIYPFNNDKGCTDDAGDVYFVPAQADSSHYVQPGPLHSVADDEQYSSITSVEQQAPSYIEVVRPKNF